MKKSSNVRRIHVKEENAEKAPTIDLNVDGKMANFFEAPTPRRICACNYLDQSGGK